MSDLNTLHKAAVWFDIPVVDLDRAIAFYCQVLAIGISKQSHQGVEFAVLAHDPGNGGCLVPNPDEVSADKGILLYMNVEGRIDDAIAKTAQHGGRVLQPKHAIGDYGFRALVLDSEGNRLALHSGVDG